MPVWLIILLFVLLLSCIATLVFYGIIWWRVWMTTRDLPTARDGIELAASIGTLPELTVIIPAHNERDVIARVARSLLASDYPNLSVVFVLDRCTDDTEDILREAISAPDGLPDPRVQVIVNESCPEGWSGKVHAMHRGYVQAAGHWDPHISSDYPWSPPEGSDPHDLGRGLVLFADADTEFHPQCLRACAALLIQRDLDLLSLLSTLTFERWYERVIQPAAAFELVRQFPLDNVNNPSKPRSFANGQFMLFRRATYEAIGGHARFKDALLEDIAIAKFFGRVRPKLRLGCLIADGMLHCEMYRDYAAFQRGWKRIYMEAAGRKPRRLRMSAIELLITGVVLPVLSELAFWVSAACWYFYPDSSYPDVLAVASILAFTAFVASMSIVFRQQHQSIWRMFWFPVGCLKVAMLLREAARDLERGIKTNWAGMSYTREAKPS